MSFAVAVNFLLTNGALAMSRDKNLWHRLGLAFGAGIQDNQLALPYEWEDFSPPSRSSSNQTARKIFRPAPEAKTRSFSLPRRVESMAA